jgi:hypothetical protein
MYFELFVHGWGWAFSFSKFLSCSHTAISLSLLIPNSFKLVVYILSTELNRAIPIIIHINVCR